MISASKSVSVKNTVFEHNMHIYHVECGQFSHTRCKFIMYHMVSNFCQFSICCYLLSAKNDQYSIIPSSKSVLVKPDFHLKISFWPNWFPPQNQLQWKLSSSSKSVSVKNTVFKHKMQILFSHTMGKFIM